MTDIIEAAKAFAQYAHRAQKRKYTGEPCFAHCQEVANLVRPVATESMIAAAFLHDTVEDCEVSPETIRAIFGDDVYFLVMDLTDVSTPSDGNRRTRKKFDLEHTKSASPQAKTIKLADVISNVGSIVERDRGFAVVYLKEKLELLNALKDGDAQLYRAATDAILNGVSILRDEGLWK